MARGQTAAHLVQKVEVDERRRHQREAAVGSLGRLVVLEQSALAIAHRLEEQPARHRTASILRQERRRDGQILHRALAVCLRLQAAATQQRLGMARVVLDHRR